MSAQNSAQSHTNPLTLAQVFPIISLVADLAQLVELLICNQWVGSSSLSIGTIFMKGLQQCNPFLFLSKTQFALSAISPSLNPLSLTKPSFAQPVHHLYSYLIEHYQVECE